MTVSSLISYIWHNWWFPPWNAISSLPGHYSLSSLPSLSPYFFCYFFLICTLISTFSSILSNCFLNPCHFFIFVVLSMTHTPKFISAAPNSLQIPSSHTQLPFQHMHLDVCRDLKFNVSKAKFTIHDPQTSSDMLPFVHPHFSHLSKI